MAKQEAVKKTTQQYIETVGRRREAHARVRLYTPAKTGSILIQGNQLKKSDFVVNGKRVQEYFPGPINKKVYLAPLKATNTTESYVISVQVRGGGPRGQLNAVVHGLARALDKIDSQKYHTILKKRGYLTRDPRARERRKAGYAQKARARKQSPKR